MSKLTREEFKALKRERLLVASLVEEINYKRELGIGFEIAHHGWVHVFSFIQGFPQSSAGGYTFNRDYVTSIEQIKALQTELQTILNTGEFPND